VDANGPIGKAEIATTLRPLAEASTLAPRFYIDPRIYALEKAHWQFIATFQGG
jgi:hypothetical protein